MRSCSSQLAAPAGTGQRGGMIHVPGTDVAPPGAAEDLSRLSQAERAARALDHGRAARQLPVDRAFLEAALDLRRTLQTLVAALVPGFADWCFVDLVDGDGVPRRVEVAHADPAKAPLAEEMRAVGFGPGWATPGAQAIRDRTPRLYRDVTDEIMEWATHDERHLAVLRAMRPTSLAAVPLVARDRAIGALTLIRSTMIPAFDEAALLLASELAVPAALALDNARRYEEERRARCAAEAELAARASSPASRGPSRRRRAPRSAG